MLGSSVSRPAFRAFAFFVLCALAIAGFASACGSSGDNGFSDGSNNNGEDSGDPGPGPIFPPGEGGTDLDGQAAQPIEITPIDQVITFTSGQPAPTVQYVAKIVATQAVVPAIFSIDRGEIGSVGQANGLFTASGNVGGKAKITAAWSGTSASTSVTVKLKVVDNGSTLVDAGADGGGAGGNGGVGGAGPGAAVDAPTVAVLHGAATADPGLGMLYPYDATVWPRGILAPLLMWKVGAQADYDALLIKITETSFEYEGTFAKNATPFVNHPIPQQAWKQMLSSNAGEEVTITLVFSKGTTAFGPVTLKWKVASAPLKGIVYYNSYGTKLALNYPGAKPNNGLFGGATLGIKGSSTDPVLVAGGNGDSSYCRVCHSVAANGSVLITQRKEGGDKMFSTYDLKGPTETTMSPEGTNANFAWSAIYPDGTMFFNDSSGAPGSSTAVNQLFSVVSGAGPQTPAAITTTGWPANLHAAFPSFSPDGKNLVFGMYSGIAGADKRTMAFTPFDKTTKTFGALKELYRPANAAHSAMYPAFLPTNDAIVFGVETRYNGRGYGETRSDGDSGGSADIGAHGELWWVNVSPTAAPVATRLDKLNGNGYLPLGAAGSGHDVAADETTLNYEPTVNPVPSGGYAWVVFTSRRQYGNVATINPFHSDPRNFDITQTPTTKKLWVAAVDLNAAPGTDPSHPAFYLPAQELLAGNSRGFWVVDPCKADGNSCETGDECCGGFCRPDTAGKLVCSNIVPQCAQEFEKCNVAADCCNAPSLQCINGRCAVPLPK